VHLLGVLYDKHPCCNVRIFHTYTGVGRFGNALVYPCALKKLTAQILVSNLVIGLLVTYALMILDNQFKIWPAAGLDYSTHSAFAVSFTLALYLLHHWAWFIVLGVYGVFMDYLGYHSWLDMITTVFAWGVLVLPCTLLLNRKLRLASSEDVVANSARPAPEGAQN
jgi:hypothetical protein